MLIFVQVLVVDLANVQAGTETAEQLAQRHRVHRKKMVITTQSENTQKANESCCGEQCGLADVWKKTAVLDMRRVDERGDDGMF